MKLSPASRTAGLRRWSVLAFSTLLALASALHAGSGPESAQVPGTGTIKGRLVWGGEAIPGPKTEPSAANAKDPVCKVKPILNKDLTVDPATKGIADGFAFLVEPSGDYSAVEKALLAKKPEVVVDQVNCEYVPYASVVHKDQKLIFKSSDPVGHNVAFQPKNSSGINPMMAANSQYNFPIKNGESLPTKATCSIHTWMKGYVFIAGHPFAVVTKADGSFEMSGVPAGVQHLIVWQSSRGFVTPGAKRGMALIVKAGETTDVGPIKLIPNK